MNLSESVPVSATLRDDHAPRIVAQKTRLALGSATTRRPFPLLP